MPIAHTVRKYLEQRAIPFEVVTHRHTVSSLRTADKAEISASSLAKAVLLEDDLEHQHFLVAVVPATRRIDLAELAIRAGRRVHLATEEDAAGLFADCEAGAIPPDFVHGGFRVSGRGCGSKGPIIKTNQPP